MKQSMLLTAFYHAYAGWLDSGAPENAEPFSREHGLCWTCTKFVPETPAGDAVVREMIAQFKAAGIGTMFPFGGFDVYDKETTTGTCHLNEQRIKWVRDHC